MSTEHNKALVRRNYDELWNQRQFDLADEFYAPDSFSIGAGGDRPPGPAGFQQMAKNFIATFPDLHFTVENMLAEGEYVATVWIASGTYQGGDPNLPASAIGKRFTLRCVTVNRLRDGKIIEGFNCMDQLEMLRQLGVMGSVVISPYHSKGERSNPMVIYIQKYDILPGKREAWATWAPTAVQTSLKVPGVIDFSTHRHVVGSHQVLALFSFATMEDWARWASDPAIQKLYDEIDEYAANHTTELWNSSPNLPDRVPASL